MKCLDQQKKDLWAHIICVNWTPEVSFVDENKNKIEGAINLERFSFKKKMGRMVQCDYKNCKVSCNVREAVERGMIFQWSKMEKMLNHDYKTSEETDIHIFCDRHRVAGCIEYRNRNKLNADG